MSETKSFSTLAVASAMTGVGLTDGLSFSLMSEISAWVLGFPVWTHELGDKVMTAKIRNAIKAQFPNMPSKEAAHADWKAAADAALQAYGETVEMVEGDGVRTETPMTSLSRMLDGAEAK